MTQAVVVWEFKDEFGFSPFSPEICKKLEQAYQNNLGSKSLADGEIIIQFYKTGFKQEFPSKLKSDSDVRRLLFPLDSCPAAGVTWAWEAYSNYFVPYEMGVQCLLEDLFSKGVENALLGVVFPNYNYSIDFVAMKQKNVYTGFQRGIRRETIDKYPVVTIKLASDTFARVYRAEECATKEELTKAAASKSSPQKSQPGLFSKITSFFTPSVVSEARILLHSLSKSDSPIPQPWNVTTTQTLNSTSTISYTTVASNSVTSVTSSIGKPLSSTSAAKDTKPPISISSGTTSSVPVDTTAKQEKLSLANAKELEKMWTCKKCTFENSDSKAGCQMCFTPRHQSSVHKEVKVTTPEKPSKIDKLPTSPTTTSTKSFKNTHDLAHYLYFKTKIEDSKEPVDSSSSEKMRRRIEELYEATSVDDQLLDKPSPAVVSQPIGSETKPPVGSRGRNLGNIFQRQDRQGGASGAKPQKEQIDENEVMRSVMLSLVKSGGISTLTELSQAANCPNNHLLPILTSKKQHFKLYEESNVKKVKYLLKLCKKHNIVSDCRDESCCALHICKEYVCGQCDNSDCVLGHDLNSVHNSEVREKLLVDDCSNTDLLKLLLSANPVLSLPGVCLDYNLEGCSDGTSCSLFHICLRMIVGLCEDEDSCLISNHDVMEQQCKQLLQKAGISVRQSRKELQVLVFERIRDTFNVTYFIKERRKPTKKFTTYPFTWSEMDASDSCKKVEVCSGTPEYEDIQSLFTNSLQRSCHISLIERIQNPYLWDTYNTKLKFICKDLDKNTVEVEKRLFHGTDYKNVDPIMRQNFDWRLSGTNVGHLYGRGAYFSNSAKYSDDYSKGEQKCMFIAKVIVANLYPGDREMKRPPPLPGHPNLLYDTTVDKVNNPKIFVKYHDQDIYPEYIISYKLT